MYIYTYVCSTHIYTHIYIYRCTMMHLYFNVFSLSWTLGVQTFLPRFGEGDIGLAGGIQLMESAYLYPQHRESIQRFGGSTSPQMPWPRDRGQETTEDERLEIAMRKFQKAVAGWFLIYFVIILDDFCWANFDFWIPVHFFWSDMSWDVLGISIPIIGTQKARNQEVVCWDQPGGSSCKEDS